MDTHDRWELKGRLDVKMDAVCHLLQLTTRDSVSLCKL